MISPGSVWYEVLELVAILRLQVIRLDRGEDESSASLYLHSSPFGIGFLSDKNGGLHLGGPCIQLYTL